MTDPVRRIADAVLYEGYLLWPYRRSALKNQRRWTFGGVYPRAHSEAHPDDRWLMLTECLVKDSEDVDVRVRFLHVVRRRLYDGERFVDELTVDGQHHVAWDEAVERDVGPGPIAIAAGQESDGPFVRSWEALEGSVTVGSAPVAEGVLRVTVEVANTTPFAGDREEALRRTFCSTHAVLRTARGEFVSITDPPDDLRDPAAACRNDGAWPVLVEDGRTMLASAIILEDFPRIAPESPGDLFDGGEIDELLTLNVLSLTDEEKAEMRATDPRAREILERSEALTEEQLLRLHGAVRRP